VVEGGGVGGGERVVFLGGNWASGEMKPVTSRAGMKMEIVDGAKAGTDRSVHAARKCGVLSREMWRLGTEWSVPVFAECGSLRNQFVAAIFKRVRGRAAQHLARCIVKVDTFMTTQLSKWGHSLALRVPKAAANSAGLREGDKLSVTVEQEGVLVIRAVRRKYSLDQLVAGITKKNRHDEIDWGRPVGKEVW
jgi:antitoxin MazE